MLRILKRDLRRLGILEKATWITIAEHYSVDVRRSATKHEIREAVLGHLRAMDVEVDNQEQELVVGDDLGLRRLQRELRFREVEAEDRQRERERED